MTEYKEVIDLEGYYDVEFKLSQDQWKEILQNQLFESYISVLLKFYEENNHCSTCKNLSEKYGKDPQYYNAKITAFTKAVQKHYNNFSIVDSQGSPTFWLIAMRGKKLENGLFEWTMRDELVAAIRELGWSRREFEILIFKRLLEYFVAHLNFLVNGENNAFGYAEYIEPLISKGKFKRTGQGYAGAAIQKQIANWEHYESGKISINIQPNYGDYKTVKCYLNWIDTGINVIVKWSGNKIIGLYLDEFIYWEKPTRRVDLNCSYSLQELGLYQKNIITDELKVFFKNYVAAHERLKNIAQKNKQMKPILEIKSILEYKKQIILQGPPGTGKTRLAKLIAGELIDAFNLDIYLSSLEVGTKFHLSNNGREIAINKQDGEKFYLDQSVRNEVVFITKDTLRATYESKDYLLTNFVSPKRFIERRIINYWINLAFQKSKEQIRMIQFHPSYTYEDFVRGIVAESNENNITYKNVNKTLGQFADLAYKNYKASQENNQEENIHLWVDEKFELFKSDIEAKLPEEETVLSGDISIFEVGNNHFKYAKTWQTPGYLKFSECKKLIKAIIKNEIDLSTSKLDKERFIHAHYRYTYYNALLKRFFEEFTYDGDRQLETPKNYVLIIDEINRANLSSVLGELIYALEYRGEPVDSMYEVEESVISDKNKIIIPPNLYIIGTMNTADRSVGHIDYAIRRRFAFVDVLPKQLDDDEEIIFHSELFKKISALFISNFDEYLANPHIKLKPSANLSSEFRPEDIWLGHSYFIQKKTNIEGSEILIPEDISTKLKYEIKPILLEYVKDGILIGKVKLDENQEVDVENYIHSL